MATAALTHLSLGPDASMARDKPLAYAFRPLEVSGAGAVRSVRSAASTRSASSSTRVLAAYDAMAQRRALDGQTQGTRVPFLKGSRKYCPGGNAGFTRAHFDAPTVSGDGHLRAVAWGLRCALTVLCNTQALPAQTAEWWKACCGPADALPVGQVAPARQWPPRPHRRRCCAAQ